MDKKYVFRIREVCYVNYKIIYDNVMIPVFTTADMAIECVNDLYRYHKMNIVWSDDKLSGCFSIIDGNNKFSFEFIIEQIEIVGKDK